MPPSEKYFVPKASTLPHFIVFFLNFDFLAVVVSEILGGPKCTLGGHSPLDAPSGKFLTYAQVLAYAYL